MVFSLIHRHTKAASFSSRGCISLSTNLAAVFSFFVFLNLIRVKKLCVCVCVCVCVCFTLLWSVQWSSELFCLTLQAWKCSTSLLRMWGGGWCCVPLAPSSHTPALRPRWACQSLISYFYVDTCQPTPSLFFLSNPPTCHAYRCTF